MPSGVPIATAMAVISRLPTIGLSRPPAAPGGGVISVKTASDRPPTPSHSRTPRMSTSQVRPNTVAAMASPAATWLRRRRRSYSAMSGSRPRVEAHDQIARQGQHDEGDEKQDKPERDQRRGVEVADRLGELVGDSRRNGGAR